MFILLFLMLLGCDHRTTIALMPQAIIKTERQAHTMEKVKVTSSILMQSNNVPVLLKHPNLLQSSKKYKFLRPIHELIAEYLTLNNVHDKTVFVYWFYYDQQNKLFKAMASSNGQIIQVHDRYPGDALLKLVERL